mmetsp:Transcript_28534/g.101049  ORF Transcript_28534/g.101049 Transcript_28534/m.101049 type:complete len:211 (+) Transcript_28534:461-1093(+)
MAVRLLGARRGPPLRPRQDHRGRRPPHQRRVPPRRQRSTMPEVKRLEVAERDAGLRDEHLAHGVRTAPRDCEGEGKGHQGDRVPERGLFRGTAGPRAQPGPGGVAGDEGQDGVRHAGHVLFRAGAGGRAAEERPKMEVPEDRQRFARPRATDQAASGRAGDAAAGRGEVRRGRVVVGKAAGVRRRRIPRVGVGPEGTARGIAAALRRGAV